MVIQAGKLNKKIVIQAASAAQDAYGSPVESWSTFADVRASVEPLQGREFFAAQQNRAELTTRFRIRYWPGVLPTMRILYDGRLFQITAVIDPNDQHRELHLMAYEVVS